MTRVTPVVVAVVALLAVSACSRSGERLGAGPDVDICDAWALIDDLDEPDLSDRGATLRWAEGVQRIVDRVDLRREVDDDPVPTVVVRHLDQVEDAVNRFVDELRDGGDDAVEQAFVELTSSDFDSSSERLTDFSRAKC